MYVSTDVQELMVVLRTHAVEEAAGLAKDPAPLGQLHLTLLECFVAVVQRLDSLFQGLTAVDEFVDFRCRGGGQAVAEFVHGSHRDLGLVHLCLEVACPQSSQSLVLWVCSKGAVGLTQLAFDIVESSNLLGEGTLEGSSLGVELHTTVSPGWYRGIDRGD